MTYKELNTFVASIAHAIGCPYSYYQGESGSVIKTPYLLFDYPDRDDVKADDKNYAKIQNVSIEYDSKKRDVEIETKIESILEESDIVYQKEETYISAQKVYEVMYTWEVPING